MELDVHRRQSALNVNRDVLNIENEMKWMMNEKKTEENDG